MNGTFEATGGARVGWTNATWPLARLTATSDSLRITVRVLGDYSFTPDTVVSITRYTMIPILGWGIQIQHCVPEYPARFVFWCLGSPDALLRGISDAGFRPQAPASSVPSRRGFALRWQVIVVAIAVWNGLFITDMFRGRQMPPFPGPFSLLAIGLLLAAVIATIRVPAFQQLVLKPGRSVGEIRPILNLLLLVSGIMFVVLLLITIFQSTATPNHALQRTAPRVTARAFCERSVSHIWASVVRATGGHAPRHAPPSLSLGSLGDFTNSTTIKK